MTVSGYRAPVADMLFVIEHVAGLDELAGYERFDHVDADTVAGILEEAGRFFAEVVAPLNTVGDREGVRVEGDQVFTATGFADAYRRYVEGGWGGVPFDPAYGGGGYPWLVALALQEMLTSANMGFSLCPLLTQGAVDLLTHHGSEEQRQTWLPNLVSGVWAGTMNLTEPQAGSDVGALATRAVPAEDGTWRITGQKIFITYGEHDLTDNIVHLVLARTPDAPPGTRGISCFIVPKFLLDESGQPTIRNDVRVLSSEHKLGIHASPTCLMAFGEEGGAVGYLIGEANAGMRYMFTMMNNARLSVGLEGLALSERAYQQAAEYARERRQGRALGAGGSARESSPIVDHADVRRMLMAMRAHIEAMRGLLYYTAACIDRAAGHPDADERARWDARTALLIPVCKAWSTDMGVELTSLGIQVHGGMGYVEETGAAQHFRDARIAPIYEGTNGIQAADLVFRKLSLEGGAATKELVADMGALADALLADGSGLADIGEALSDGVRAFTEAADWLTARLAAEPNHAAAGSTPFTRLAGIVIGGYFMARMAEVAAQQLAAGQGDAAFLADKIATARFYAHQVMPQAAGLVPAATDGADLLFAIDADRL
jgi:alkylation response protein AidB-like acyl-CoA dehydrogenase